LIRLAAADGLEVKVDGSHRSRSGPAESGRTRFLFFDHSGGNSNFETANCERRYKPQRRVNRDGRNKRCPSPNANQRVGGEYASHG
jgi:hypothetical protein